MPHPRAERLSLPPLYHLPAQPPDTVAHPWSTVQEKLANARNYWVVTSDPDGWPQAVPLWAIWFEDAIYFGMGRGSRTQRNIAANPHVLVHLESGNEVVIVKGIAEEVTDPDHRERVDVATEQKYPFSTHPTLGVVYMLRPILAYSWSDSRTWEDATRWQFERA